MSIIRKEINNPCYRCDGSGKVGKKKCPTCKGTGNWKDSMCFYIDDKKKIAVDGESGQ